MNKKLECWLMVFALLMWAFPATAQIGLSDGDGKAPVEIEADEAIEWVRDQKQYIARGNAVAIQDDYRVEADELIADYEDDANGQTRIYQFTAKGSVHMVTGNYEAFGDQAVYDVDSGKTILTGDNVHIKSGDMRLKASHRIEFDGKNNQAKAVGRPRVEQKGQVAEADHMTGYFAEDNNGKMVLDRVIGNGNVRLITAEEILQGNKADYSLKTGKAVVTGNVKITRGVNQLNGHKAIFDTKKGVSTLFAEPEKTQNEGNSGKKRVRGLFYIGGDEKKLTPSTP